MTRAEAEAFLNWFKTATEAQSVVESSEVVEDPAVRDERNRVMGEVLAIFAPVVDVVDTLFNAEPGEGLAVKSDKSGTVHEVVRARQPRIALS
jgi:hypothetical protein